MSQPQLLPDYRQVGRPYWIAAYSNGGLYPEFFFNGDKCYENQFDRIQREQLRQFLFTGPVNIGFEASGGTFFAGHYWFEFALTTTGGDQAVRLTCPKLEYGQFLRQFKTGATDFMGGISGQPAQQRSFPCIGFSFGWRRDFYLNGSKLDVEVLLRTDLLKGTPEPATSRFQVTVTADKALNLTLLCYRGDARADPSSSMTLRQESFSVETGKPRQVVFEEDCHNWK